MQTAEILSQTMCTSGKRESVAGPRRAGATSQGGPVCLQRERTGGPGRPEGQAPRGCRATATRRAAAEDHRQGRGKDPDHGRHDDGGACRLLLFPAGKRSQVEAGNPGGRLIEALAQFDFGADLLGKCGRHMEGPELAIDTHGEEEPGMEFLSDGTAAVWLAAFARAFHKGAGEHLAKGAQAPDQSAPKIQFGTGGHGLVSDAHNSGRARGVQGLSKICRNGTQHPGGGQAYANRDSADSS